MNGGHIFTSTRDTANSTNTKGIYDFLTFEQKQRGAWVAEPARAPRCRPPRLGCIFLSLTPLRVKPRVDKVNEIYDVSEVGEVGKVGKANNVDYDEVDEVDNIDEVTT